ncbi:MAG TPA: MBL fold metallo-hydrolase [Syntrophorhabdaceae bacterium]|nr:MBL fold metallo-hydrolase [Syntrophorhabdaceae bacterium]
MNQEIRQIALGFVNTYLVKVEGGHLLIDTGLGEQWSRLETELRGAGCLPEQLKLVVLTHGDVDHAGNCDTLQQKYGVKVAMHAGDAEMVRTGRFGRRRAKGITFKVLHWFGGRARRNFRIFEPDILLEHGQTLNQYGLSARIIHAPGHTKGSIAILTEDGQLFAGDTVSNRDKPDSAPFIENAEQLRDSLTLLKGLGARTVYPGHGKPFSAQAMASITV